jgi:hypothetical protein
MGLPQTPNGIKVTLEHFHIVPVGLPILQVTLVGARQHQLLVATPDH